MIYNVKNVTKLYDLWLRIHMVNLETNFIIILAFIVITITFP